MRSRLTDGVNVGKDHTLGTSIKNTLDEPSGNTAGDTHKWRDASLQTPNAELVGRFK